MSTGKIQFAEQNGSFVLKFVGEVRLTLCSALDSTIEKIFAALNFSAIIIDLTETQSIDSTTSACWPSCPSCRGRKSACCPRW